MTEPGYSDHIYVDLTSAEYAARFTSSEVGVYRKTARAKAWLLTQDTPLTTVLADGTRETDRVAPAGHWVVENPGGERYAIEPEEFEAGYDTTSEPGVFQAKGRIRAIQNTTGGPVWINAPWGEPQYGATDCSFACTVRADGSLDLAQPYIVGRAELNQTYAEDAVEAVPTASELAPTRFISIGQAPAQLATARGSDTESGTERTGKAARGNGEASRRTPTRPGAEHRNV